MFGSMANDTLSSDPTRAKLELHMIPGIHRYTDTHDGSTVVTCKGHGRYESYVCYAEGGTSESKFTFGWQEANLVHDGLVYQAGGRKGSAPA